MAERIPEVDLGLRHNPPWKPVLFAPDSETGGIWTVTTDRGDPADEYDVYEDPCERTARLHAASWKLLAAARDLMDWFRADATTTAHEATRIMLDKFEALRAAVAEAEGGRSDG